MVLSKLLVASAGLLVAKVAINVVIGYRSYLPPDFESDFLVGREAYFYGPYQWAFYAHCVAGPISLLAGTMLVSASFQRRAPGWHRRLGRVHMAVVLFVLVPSGLWMAPYAATGATAALGLGLLAIVTASCAVFGWRAAVVRRFSEHERWMWRLYLLLCSAVIIRLMGGLASVMQWDANWYYPFSVWISWAAPLITFEMISLLGGSRIENRPVTGPLSGSRPGGYG